MARDEAMPVDPDYARSMIEALAAKLDPIEMQRILAILKAADLLTTEEEADVNAAMADDPGVEPVTASDSAHASFYARFPNAAHIRVQSGGHAEAMARDAALRRKAAGPSADFANRFPDAMHIKELR